MTLIEVRDQHGLNIRQVAKLLGNTVGTITTYCSTDSDRSRELADNLDNMIKNAYDVAEIKLGDKRIRDVAIKQVAKQIIMRNYRLGTEAYRIFSILSS